jgi:hypothetical protein
MTDQVTYLASFSDQLAPSRKRLKEPFAEPVVQDRLVP